MVILYIEHDVNNLMQEVRDTFYVERILEKRHLEWGFTTYWNFEIDELIAKGQWDGLKDTRTLYDAAMVGGKMNIGPAYPSVSDDVLGENRIPNTYRWHRYSPSVPALRKNLLQAIPEIRPGSCSRSPQRPGKLPEA